MNLNALLNEKHIEPKQVLVMRHRPPQPDLRRVLPWLAAEKPDIFNAYQQTQRPNVEASLKKAKYLASFIAHEGRQAIFVGIYKAGKWQSVSYDAYWRKPVTRELKKQGATGFEGDRPSCFWFDLIPTEIYSDWKGKLIVKWPPGMAFARWADRNEFPVTAILEESALVPNMIEAENMTLSWEQLRVLPKSYKLELSRWRGIYYIFDVKHRKGYVGAAYGKSHILGRWEGYKKKYHGGNKRLRKCKAQNLRFSILQVVPRSTFREDVLRLESAWKKRLHTREFGLNDN